MRWLTPEILDSQSLSVVYRRDVLLSPPVQTVLRFLAEVTRAHMRVLHGGRAVVVAPARMGQ